LENTPDRVKVTLSIPAELPQLAGHFPGNPVTPSIVLIEITNMLAVKYFALESTNYKSLKRSKVPRMILPEVTHTLEISKQGESDVQGVWSDSEENLCAKFNLEF
jgi:3-hydroxymyristoyl/3-hydroxydecanoyl-(acyl carrier protein) dehydratase